MQELTYTPYTPRLLPIRLPVGTRLKAILAQAQSTIATFNTLLTEQENSFQLLQLLSVQEAIDSLNVHEPKTSLKQVFIDRLLKKLTEQEKSLFNYLPTLAKTCSKRFDHSLVQTLHQTIRKKAPPSSPKRKGYRKKQNWIGPKGKSIDEAYFFPPAPSELPALMDNLIAYWHKSEKEPLVQLALIFAQLLIVHPFMDGNGRTARMLIPIFLYQKGLISSPLFFLSRYFKRHRLAYFQHLYAITAEGKWDRWVEFFLKGIVEQGNKNCAQAKKTLSFYNTLKQQLLLQWPEKKAKKILLFLFENPLFTQASCRLHHSRQIIDFLLSQQIIKRGRIQKKTYFVFSGLL